MSSNPPKQKADEWADSQRVVGGRFPKRMRLRKRREFLRVQRHTACRKVHGEHFLLLVAPREATGQTADQTQTERPIQGARVGITVSKKVGNAVTRNRVKRLVRECVRRQPELLPGGCDVVVVAKRCAAEVIGVEQVRVELTHLWRRLSPC